MKLSIKDLTIDSAKIKELAKLSFDKLALLLRLVIKFIYNVIRLKAIETDFEGIITKVRSAINIAATLFLLFYWPIALLMLHDLNLSQNSKYSLLAEIIFTLPLLPFLAFIRFITFLSSFKLVIVLLTVSSLLVVCVLVSVVVWRAKRNYDDLLSKLPPEVPPFVSRNVGLFSKNIALFSLLTGSLLIMSHFKYGPAAIPVQTPIWIVDPASVFIWILGKIPGYFPLYSGSFAAGLAKDIVLTFFTIFWIYAALIIVKLGARHLWDSACVLVEQKCK